MKTGLSRQSPASAQTVQDVLRSLQPLCVTGKKEETREYYTRQGAQTAALHAVNKLIEQVSG